MRYMPINDKNEYIEKCNEEGRCVDDKEEDMKRDLKIQRIEDLQKKDYDTRKMSGSMVKIKNGHENNYSNRLTSVSMVEIKNVKEMTRDYSRTLVSKGEIKNDKTKCRLNKFKGQKDKTKEIKAPMNLSLPMEDARISKSNVSKHPINAITIDLFNSVNCPSNVNIIYESNTSSSNINMSYESKDAFENENSKMNINTINEPKNHYKHLRSNISTVCELTDLSRNNNSNISTVSTLPDFSQNIKSNINSIKESKNHYKHSRSNISTVCELTHSSRNNNSNISTIIEPTDFSQNIKSNINSISELTDFSQNNESNINTIKESIDTSISYTTATKSSEIRKSINKNLITRMLSINDKKIENKDINKERQINGMSNKLELNENDEMALLYSKERGLDGEEVIIKKDGWVGTRKCAGDFMMDKYKAYKDIRCNKKMDNGLMHENISNQSKERKYNINKVAHEFIKNKNANRQFVKQVNGGGVWPEEGDTHNRKRVDENSSDTMSRMIKDTLHGMKSGDKLASVRGNQIPDCQPLRSFKKPFYHDFNLKKKVITDNDDTNQGYKYIKCRRRFNDEDMIKKKTLVDFDVTGTRNNGMSKQEDYNHSPTSKKYCDKFGYVKNWTSKEQTTTINKPWLYLHENEFDHREKERLLALKRKHERRGSCPSNDAPWHSDAERINNYRRKTMYIDKEKYIEERILNEAAEGLLLLSQSYEFNKRL